MVASGEILDSHQPPGTIGGRRWWDLHTFIREGLCCVDAASVLRQQICVKSVLSMKP